MSVLHRVLAAVAVLVVLSCPCAMAGPVINDPVTWGPGSGLSGWTNAVTIGSEEATLSNPGTYLNIGFGQQVGEPQFEQDTVYTVDPDETGNFTGVNLRFSMYAEDILPLSSVVYMHSANTPGGYWQYEFANTGVGAWVQHEIGFVYSGDWVWSAGAGSEVQFWSDLAQVDWIGVNIARNLDTMAQDYRLDDWEYYYSVPEPGAVYVLVSSLLSMGLVFRKRLKFAVAGASKVS